MYCITIGSVRFRIEDNNLLIPDMLHEFCTDREDAPADVTVCVSRTFQSVPRDAVFRGEDVLLQYFSHNGILYAAAKPGKFGPVTAAALDMQTMHIQVYVNEAGYPGSVSTIMKLLQLLPIREILLHFHAWTLHASRIRIGRKAVLFTAPSGTGKTTQANLWHAFENAEILCNDRTVLRKLESGVCTYGFPVDGSSPVLKNAPLPLGAIVVLQQGQENAITKLSALKAVRYLMEQTVADGWNTQAMLSLRDYWLGIVTEYPVYHLICKPDEGAVACLKERLTMDGVI